MNTDKQLPISECPKDGLNVNFPRLDVWEQVKLDIKSIKTNFSTLQSTVCSFEAVLKDHDSILSLYNSAVELNERYLSEIHENKEHITSLEQKIIKLEEERDSAQLATRLIAQDKYCKPSPNAEGWQNVQ